MSEEVCTAEDHQRNPLVTPECSCPRCRDDAERYRREPGRWLRVSGRRQRLRVEPWLLGPGGRALLGDQ